MDTNSVIDHLVKDLRPVKPIGSLTSRLTLWLSLVALVVGGFVAVIAAHRDLELALRSGRLLMDVGAVIALALTAAWAALRLSVPGEEGVWAHKYLPVGLLLFWMGYAAIQLVVAVTRGGLKEVVPDTHVACALLTAGIGGLLMIPLGYLIRKAAPLDPRWCGAIAGLAAGSAAMVGIEVICAYERPVHFLAYHVLPVTLFVAAGAAAGPKLLKAA